MTLNDQRVIVTGGSRGLGAALGRELALAGARVVLVARDEAALHAVAAGIRAEGGAAYALPADLAAKDAIYSVSGAAAGLIGPIDVLINGAATLGPLPMPLLLDTPCEDFESVLQLNLLGPFRLAKAVVGSMAVRGGGLVINVTSDAAVVAYPRWGAYGAAKAALEHLTRIWAAELAETGVRIVSVDPGEMDTRMHAEAMPDADRTSLPSPEDAARALVAFIQGSDCIRGGERVDLAPAVAAEQARRTAARARPGTEVEIVAPTGDLRSASAMEGGRPSTGRAGTRGRA